MRFRNPIVTSTATLLVCACSGAPANTNERDSGFHSQDGGAAQGSTLPGLVETTKGPVRGRVGRNSSAFLGIPYAAPPTGSLRWTPPTEAAPWSSPHDATAYGNICPQPKGTGPGAPVQGAEDCLYLNVWTPSTTPAKPLPALVFLHGGGNWQGAGSLPLYDGQALAEAQHVVVVTLNYRLGALGYLALPQLDAEGAHGVSGNYGILDQIAALRWVQANIAAFGGDTKHVLLFGESEGADAACVHMTSDLSAGLFSAVLTESAGTCAHTSLADEEQLGQSIVAAAGCSGASDVLACMRSVSAADLAELVVRPSLTSSAVALGTNIDGYVVPERPLDRFKSGSYNHVPAILGVNADEYAYFYLTGDPRVPPIPDESAYEAAVKKAFPKIAAKVLSEYPASDYASDADPPRKAFIEAMTDAMFVCQARAFARAIEATGLSKVYRYLFSHAMDGGPTALWGAYHTLELPFVFESFSAYFTSGYAPTKSEVALSDSIGGYWARFAATGDPNGSGATAWPVNTSSGDPYIDFDTPVRSEGGMRTAKCDFWDKFEAP